MEQDPEEVGEHSSGAGARVQLEVLEVVEHERDAAGERQHDHEEGDEEHHHVFHQCIDADDDRAKVLGCDPDLDHLDYCQSEGNPPEYSSRRADCRDACSCSRLVLILNLLAASHHVLKAANTQSCQEQQVHHDVVVVPEGEVSLFKSSNFWTRSFQTP